ncbi:MAG: hypothetical protein KIH67_004125 [Candidatus Moranbacteria bacterium]|nr:hypothetical protein [Candidatus Moranbacteria bacterium]
MLTGHENVHLAGHFKLDSMGREIGKTETFPFIEIDWFARRASISASPSLLSSLFGEHLSHHAVIRCFTASNRSFQARTIFDKQAILSHALIPSVR